MRAVLFFLLFFLSSSRGAEVADRYDAMLPNSTAWKNCDEYGTGGGVISHGTTIASDEAACKTLCLNTANCKYSAWYTDPGDYCSLYSKCTLSTTDHPNKPRIYHRATLVDPGFAARCQVTLSGVPRGNLSCPTSQSFCFTRDGHGTGNGYNENEGKYTAYLANASNTKCAAFWGSEVSCPDGIGERGVLLTDGYRADPPDKTVLGCPTSQGTEGCPINTCMAWSQVGTLTQVCHPSGKVCTKAQVLHPHGSSKSTGTLILKRLVCGDDGVCKVFKVAQCVDVERSIWSSTLNNKISDANAQAKTFGEAAEPFLRGLRESTSATRTAANTISMTGTWSAFAGRWNVVYGNGFNIILNITGAGAVTASPNIGTGQLVSSTNSECAGTPCAHVAYWGTTEQSDYLSVTSSGEGAQMSVRHVNAINGHKDRAEAIMNLQQGACSAHDQEHSRRVVISA